MSSIAEIAGYTGTHSSISTSKSNTELSMTDYLTLLIAQMSNQDATNPMETSEMVAQLAQMATVEAMSSFQEMSNNSYATGLLGKEVTVADIDTAGRYQGYTTGVVTGISLYNGSSQIIVGEKSYSLSQVMTVTQPSTSSSDAGTGTGADTAAGPGAGTDTGSTNEASTGPASAIESSYVPPKKDDDEELEELEEALQDRLDEVEALEEAIADREVAREEAEIDA